MSANLETHEETVLGIARHLMRTLNVCPTFGLNGQMTIAIFESTLATTGVKYKLMEAISKFEAPKLGIIVCSFGGKNSLKLKNSEFRSIFPKNRVFFDGRDTGYNELCDIAYGIIVSAMYEILMTGLWISDNKTDKDDGVFIYTPNPAMKSFVSGCKDLLDIVKRFTNPSLQT